MTVPNTDQGIAFSCDARGKVTKIFRDDLAAAVRIPPGSSFLHLADPASLQTASAQVASLSGGAFSITEPLSIGNSTSSFKINEFRRSSPEVPSMAASSSLPVPAALTPSPARISQRSPTNKWPRFGQPPRN